MLRFLQRWFMPGSNPIGVDFGSDSLRLAQVELLPDGEHRLIAAASAVVPVSIRSDPVARLDYLSQALRELLVHGNFRGRRAILSLPASMMEIQLLRVRHMEELELRQSLPAAARGLISFPVEQAVLRHVVAGPVGAEPGSDEVVLMAARREQVDAMLKSARDGRLDVIGMNVEPKALIDCFDHVYRRKIDIDVTNCFVDMGCAGTRVMIGRGGRLLFGRWLPQGGALLDRAVAEALQISREDARLLRMKTTHPASGAAVKRPLKADRHVGRNAVDESHVPPVPFNPAPLPSGATHQQLQLIERACEPVIDALIDGLMYCRACHDMLFPSVPIDRLIFVGGEACHRDRCLRIASALNLEAQVGDPMVRMGRLSDVGIESGIDRRLPQPGWGVALGLSMGSPAAAQTNPDRVKFAA